MTINSYFAFSARRPRKFRTHLAKRTRKCARFALQRRGFNVLADALKPKLEYIVRIYLTTQQIKLYNDFLDHWVPEDRNVRQKALLGNCYIFKLVRQ